MVNKTQTIGWSGTILILLVIAGATIFTDDYRQMLIDNPAATYIMLDYAENEKIEFITRGISDFLRWKYTEDKWTLYSGRYIGLEEDWLVYRQRTYLNLIKVADTSICSRTTATRCYVDDYFEPLDRKRTLVSLDYTDLDGSIQISKNTPYYAYPYASGSGGTLTQTALITDSSPFDQFPEDYTIEFDPAMASNYQLVWRINAKPLAGTDYSNLGCSVDFKYNMKVSWCDELAFVEKAEWDATRSQLRVYFNPTTGPQTYSVIAVDPASGNFTLDGYYNASVRYEFDEQANVTPNQTMCFNIAHPLYGYNYTCTNESFLINLSNYLNITNSSELLYYFMNQDNETNSSPYLDSWLDLIEITVDGLGDEHPRVLTQFDDMTGSSKEYNISPSKLINLTMWNASNLDMATMSLQVKTSGATPTANLSIDMGNNGYKDFNLTSVNSWTIVEFNVTLFNNLTEITNVTTQFTTIPFNFSADAGYNITIRNIEFKRDAIYNPEDLYLDIGNSSYDDIYLSGTITSFGQVNGLDEGSINYFFEEVNIDYPPTPIVVGQVISVYLNTTNMDNSSVFESYLKHITIPSFNPAINTLVGLYYLPSTYAELFTNLSNINTSASTAEILDNIGFVYSNGSDSKILSNTLTQSANVTKVYLRSGYTNLSGIDTNFYVSNNGTWYEVNLSNDITAFTEYNFTSSGPDFRWKAEFNSTTGYASGDKGWMWYFEAMPAAITGFEVSTTTGFYADNFENVTLDVGNDGTIDMRWSNVTEMNAAKTLTSAVNSYRTANCKTEQTCEVPFNFSYQGPGEFLVYAFYIKYNLSGMDLPEQPFNYYLKDKAVDLANRTAFNDSTTTKQLNTSNTGYISIPREILAHDFNLTITGEYQ